MSGNFNVCLSYEDCLAANWLHNRRHWLWRKLTKYWLGVAVLYTALIAVITALDKTFELSDIPQQALYGLGGATLVLVLLLGISFVTLPRRVRRLYSQSGLIGLDVAFQFDDLCLQSFHPETSTSFAWSRFLHRGENDQFVLLYLTEHSFHILPKRQIQQETLESLQQTIRAASIPLR